MTRSPGQIILLSARILLGVVTVVLFVALFFWLAGRLDWARGWAYIGLITIGQSISGLYVWRRDGPYRIVRHPGYLGAIFGFILAAPLLLGSWWAFVPAVLAIVCFVVRTALEDRTLQKELDGYVAYTQNVRYRLLPGVW